jgi:hypothetical protein
MRTNRSRTCSRQRRSIFPAVLGAVVALLTAIASQAADPPRMKRAEAFLGIHFDFHAGKDCDRVGARTTPEMVQTVIEKVKPDYLQIDCKGHPGYSSYPTKVGNPAPGFVGDPLRIWREVTRQRGIPLFMHYSGVWDGHAVAAHRDWAAIHASGKPDDKATSVFGPYADQLLIPQLRELAGEYGVDGAWVDGDCWATIPDYGEKAVREFCKQTGAQSAPRKAGEPYWTEWLDFHREGFRRYVRHYVDELKASHPDFQVISNWAFSDHMPEPVSANVAGLSGDFSPDDSVNSARFAGRCLEDQGVPWDLMSWSFSRKTRKQKPAVQLMQEAAVVLAMGGGYQAYFKQDRDGAVRDLAEMDVMAQVAQFCRERQALLPSVGFRSADRLAVLDGRSLSSVFAAVSLGGQQRRHRPAQGPYPDPAEPVRRADSQRASTGRQDVPVARDHRAGLGVSGTGIPRPVGGIRQDRRQPAADRSRPRQAVRNRTAVERRLVHRRRRQRRRDLPERPQAGFPGADGRGPWRQGC